MRVPHRVVASSFVASLLIFATSPSLAQPVVTLQEVAGQLPPEFDFDSVYGEVTFRVRPPRKRNGDVFTDTRAIYFGFRQLAIRISEAHRAAFQIAGKTKSTFVLTLEVLNNNTVIFRDPIASISTESEYAVLMRKKSKDVFEIDNNRTIISYVPINSSNNRLRVRLQAHAVDEGMFDLSVLKEIVTLGNQIGKVKAAPLSPATDVTFAAIEKIVKSVFDASSQATISNVIELSFTRARGEPATGSTRAVATISLPSFTARDGSETFSVEPMTIPIELAFTFKQTRLPSRSAVYANTTIEIGTGSVTIVDALRTSKDQRVRYFLDELETKEKFESRNTGEACLTLYDALFKYLTARDAALFYHSFLGRHKAALARSNAPEECTGTEVSRRLAEWDIKLKGTGLAALSIDLPVVSTIAIPSVGAIALPKGTFPLAIEK